MDRDTAMGFLDVVAANLSWDLKRGIDELADEWRSMPDQYHRERQLPDLARLTTTELATLRADLVAERTDLIRRKAAGELVEQPQTFRAWLNIATLACQTARWFYGATNCAPLFKDANVCAAPTVP
jgi:hypothetical protein